VRRRARRFIATSLAASVLSVIAAGCVDRTPPPPDAPIPERRGGAQRYEDPIKPLSRADEADEQAGSLPPPPFNDEPLVSQGLPEEPVFLQAYNGVGRPRMVVLVNRSLDGELLPANDGGGDGFSDRAQQNSDERARGAYLRPDQYDQSTARQIDYEAIEIGLTDWMSAGGRTEIVSPITARQRLSDDQERDLQGGRARVMGDIARELDADVLIHVTARPTRQTRNGLEIRLIAEAINLGKGGQSIGRGFVDVPPPLDKTKINRFTRFLARVLMDRMSTTWENLPPPPRDDDRGGATSPKLREDDRDVPASAPAPERPAAPIREIPSDDPEAKG
jgi:hypothetical protein